MKKASDVEASENEQKNLLGNFCHKFDFKFVAEMKFLNRHNNTRRTMVRERFAVQFINSGPIVDIGDVDAAIDDVLNRSATETENLSNDLKNGFKLLVQ